MERTSRQVRDISRSEIEYAIDEWIVGKNAERDRKLLRRRLIDGVVFERLAEEFDLSVRQTKEIIYKGQEKVFRHIP